jgi:hypothetical protein
MTHTPENIPRRMKRFYRKAIQEKSNLESEYTIQNNEDTYDINKNNFNKYENSDNSSAKNYLENSNESLESAFKKIDNLSEDRKKELNSIPSMEYEDLNLDEKNARELKKIGENEMEEKLALFEIEKFKKEKNRMPTNEEKSLLAENIFNQLENEKETQSTELNRREMRRQRNSQTNSGNIDIVPKMEKIEEQNKHIRHGRQQQAKDLELKNPTNLDKMNNIKDLLDNEKSIKNDDLDLGLGDLSEDSELEDISDLDFDLEEKKKKKKI